MSTSQVTPPCPESRNLVSPMVQHDLTKTIKKKYDNRTSSHMLLSLFTFESYSFLLAMCNAVWGELASLQKSLFTFSSPGAKRA